jgi:hypothetical protein
MAAVLVAVTAALVQWLLWLVLPPAPHLVFYPAVFLVARFAGRGPGLLATVLSALEIAYWFLPPYASASIAAPEDFLDLVIFCATAGTMCFLVEGLKRSRVEAQQTAKVLATVIDDCPIGIGIVHARGIEVEIIAAPSVEAALRFPARSVDRVFLDASHDGPSVSEDLLAWSERLRPDGILAGHDYGPNHPALRDAVDTFAAARDLVVRRGPRDIWWLAPRRVLADESEVG